MRDPGGYELGYRADIEGLRAVAIVLVVAAHAGLPGLDGGFVGVDVFFVLSGYLITGLLLRQMSIGTFGFADFYARRLRRLLPGLLLMLAVTSVFAYLLVAPDQHAGQARAATGAAVWLSNFVFAFGNLDYFTADAETNLFLHTWSLGVEEQFYLVWPVLLLLASAHAADLRRLRFALCGVFVLSLALCIAWTHSRPLLAFYMMPTRGWQFALGALTLLAVTRNGKWNAGIYVSGWLGLAAIAGAALCFDRSVPYPGFRALLPSLGAAAVLAAGSRGTGGVARFLSVSPMQAIGRVSYAWYLWHWPVLLLGAAVAELSIWNRVALALLSLAVGAFSYYFFESPIRRNARLIAKPVWTATAALVSMVVVASLCARWSAHAQQRMSDPDMVRFEQVRSEKMLIYQMGCDEWYHSARVNLCLFGAVDAEHTAVAIGDSVGLQWFPAYYELFVRPGWRLLVATKSSCPMVDESLFYTRIGREYTECARWRNDVLHEVSSLHPNVVLVGSSHMAPYSQAQWTEGTARVLDLLSKSSDHVYLMRSTPVLPFDGPSCLEPRSRLYDVLSTRRECVASARNSRRDAIYEWLGNAASRFDNVSLVDMTDAICPQELCYAERNGTIVFRDDQHLSAAFVQSLAGVLADRLVQSAQDRARNGVSAVPQSSP